MWVSALVPQSPIVGSVGGAVGGGAGSVRVRSRGGSTTTVGSWTVTRAWLTRGGATTWALAAGGVTCLVPPPVTRLVGNCDIVSDSGGLGPQPLSSTQSTARTA